jgi:hypothetical protein
VSAVAMAKNGIMETLSMETKPFEKESLVEK